MHKVAVSAAFFMTGTKFKSAAKSGKTAIYRVALAVLEKKTTEASPVLSPAREDMNTGPILGRLAGMSLPFFHIGDRENGEH